MSARLAWTVRRNAYFDSIDLMQIAEQARQLGGVIDAAVVMGTVSGRSMLEEAGMWSSEAPEAGPSDLLIAIGLLGRRPGTSFESVRSDSLRGATLALRSTGDLS